MKETKVYNYLDEKNINIFSLVKHKGVFTMEEAADLDIHLDGTDCKNLFLEAKKEKRYILISVAADKKLNLKDLTEKLQVKKLNFASESKLEKFLDLTPGGVTPMGLINDPDNLVEYYLDEDFKNTKKICFHPNTNKATMTLELGEFEKYIVSLNRKLNWIKI